MAHYGRGRYTHHPRGSVARPARELEPPRAPDIATPAVSQQAPPDPSAASKSSTPRLEPTHTLPSADMHCCKTTSANLITPTTRMTRSQAKRARSPTPNAEDADNEEEEDSDARVTRRPRGKKLRFILPKPSPSRSKGKSRARESDDESESETKPEHQRKRAHEFAGNYHPPGPQGPNAMPPQPTQRPTYFPEPGLDGYVPASVRHSLAVPGARSLGIFGNGPVVNIEGDPADEFHSERLEDLQSEESDDSDVSVSSYAMSEGTYQHGAFSMLRSFMKYPELILNLASHLSVVNLIDLYAISVDFHFIMNSHYTTYIRHNVQRFAPRSDYIFPWRCYRILTIKDPQARVSESRARMLSAVEISNPSVKHIRDVPSLKWLVMAYERHRVCENIIDSLKTAGHIFPRGMIDVLKKIWFTMDLPTTYSRIGVLHNGGYWLDHDIFLATLFFMKLDLRFNDPVEGGGELSLRCLLMGCRNLIPLHTLLHNKARAMHVLQLKVWYDWVPRNPLGWNLRVLGVPGNLIGRGCTERWGHGAHRLLRVDQVILRESIRRKMPMNYKVMDLVMVGVTVMHEERKRLATLEAERKKKELSVWLAEARKKCLELKAKGDFEGMGKVIERAMDPDWDGRLSGGEEEVSEEENEEENEEVNEAVEEEIEEELEEETEHDTDDQDDEENDGSEYDDLD